MNFTLLLNDPIAFILLITFCTALFFQLIYYWFIFGRLAFYKQKKSIHNDEPVSVVICAKNEYSNLKNNLPMILEQDYPNLEVIVVNDASDDETYYLLKIMSDKYKHLKIVTIKEDVNFFKGKKFPLTIGIKSAKHDVILLTDADCRPGSMLWVKKMAEQFKSETEIVLGYGKYKQEKGFLNKLIRFDTFFIGLQYLSYSLCGMTYMGVGRNLAYRKSLFYSNNGFINHYKIKSGDDDLFINQAATSKNTKIAIDFDCHTVSQAKNTLSNWLTQKRRHLTTGRYYKISTKLMLGFYSLTLLTFFTTFVSLLIYDKNNIFLFLALFTLRLISQLIIHKRIMNKLDEKKFLLLTPVFEIFFLILNPLIVLFNIYSKPDKWK